MVLTIEGNEIEDFAPDGVYCVYDESAPKYSILKLKELQRKLGRRADTFSDEELALCLCEQSGRNSHLEAAHRPGMMRGDLLRNL